MSSGVAASRYRRGNFGLTEPGRELAPRHPTTRTKAAEVQIAGVSPAIPRHPYRRLQRLQHPAASDLPTHAAPGQGRGPSGVGGSDGRCLKRRMGQGFGGAGKLTCQFHPRRRLQHLQHSASPSLSTHAAPGQGRGSTSVGVRDDRDLTRPPDR